MTNRIRISNGVISAEISENGAEIKSLKKGKSTQFDPEIAELMIELIKEDTEYTMHE